MLLEQLSERHRGRAVLLLQQLLRQQSCDLRFRLQLSVHRSATDVLPWDLELPRTVTLPQPVVRQRQHERRAVIVRVGERNLLDQAASLAQDPLPQRLHALGIVWQ